MDAIHHKPGLMRLPSRRLPMLAGAFVVMVCMAIMGLSGWRAWSARESALENAEENLANLARSLTQHAEDTVDLLDASIVGLVIRLEVEGAGPEALPNFQKVLMARKAGLERIYNIIICDENGNWLATSGTPGPNISDREFFRHHLQSPSREPFLGQPVKSRITGEWIITVSRRFNHPDGSFGGIVIATTGAEYLSRFYRQFNLGLHSSIVLTNTDGIVMARSPDDGSYVGRDLSRGPLFRDPSLRSGSGVHNFLSSLDNTQRVSVYQWSERYPLLILATRSRDEVLAPWRDAAIARLLVVAGLVLLIALMGYYLVRQLLRGQRLTAELAAKEASFRSLAEGSSDMVTRIGMDEKVTYASPSSIRILGWPPDQLLGKPALAGVDPRDLPRVRETIAALKRGEVEETRIAYRTRHPEKSEIWVESTLRLTRNDGKIDAVIAITRDVTQQKNLEGRLETLATVDGLTGLANRRRFDERLLEEWGRAYRERTCLSLLMIDLDHFKTYNDEYGHPAGDECLRRVARVLATEAKRTTDLAARYGGEEFAMLLPNTDAAGCARIAERILREIRDAGLPHKLNFPSRIVTASIGGAVCRPGVERSAGHASLIDDADHALYAAKDGGRDQLFMAKPAEQRLAVASAAY